MGTFFVGALLAAPEKLMPAQQAAIEADYQAALKALPDARAKADGVAVGEQAAAAVLASCADDGAVAPDTYRPHTTPGVYVPTLLPAVPHWGKRTPWVMTTSCRKLPSRASTMGCTTATRVRS